MNGEFIHPPKHPRAPHEMAEARASYAADVRKAGIDTAITLLGQDRPGSALRAVAGVVEAELAIAGYPGVRIHVADGMARLIAAKHYRKAMAA